MWYSLLIYRLIIEKISFCGYFGKKKTTFVFRSNCEKRANNIGISDSDKLESDNLESSVTRFAIITGVKLAAKTQQPICRRSRAAYRCN